MLIAFFLHTVLKNRHNFSTDLFNPLIGPEQVIPLWVKVDWQRGNGNKGLLHSPLIFQSGISPSDAFNQDTLFFWRGIVVLPLCNRRLLIFADSTQVKLATLVEKDLKASFSIATTPRCRRGRYSFPRIAPLYP